MPEIDAPLSTYTGWSMRSVSFSNTLRRNAGKVWPFAVTAEERRSNGDPRMSILERYPTKKDYLYAVMKSLLILQKKRLLLDEDMDFLLKEAAEQDFWSTNEEERLISIKSITVTPAEVKRGETVKITVEIEGSIKDIFSFRIIWREAPRLRIHWDEEQKGENTKICSVEIGEGFPLGTFHFDIRAFDRHFNPIYLTGSQKVSKGEVPCVMLTVK
jgi:hypothetical protein